MPLDTLTLGIISAVIAVVVILVAVLAMRKRKAPEPAKPEAPQALPPPPPPPLQPDQPAPPAPQAQVEPAPAPVAPPAPAPAPEATPVAPPAPAESQPSPPAPEPARAEAFTAPSPVPAAPAAPAVPAPAPPAPQPPAPAAPAAASAGPTRKLTKKVILIGDGGVGKTTLIGRFVFGMFDDKYIQTIGTNVKKKVLNYPELGTDLTVMIWDVQGQRNDPLLNRYFTGAEGALLVCDGTRMQTFENLPLWVTDFHNTVGTVPVLFLENKTDLKDALQFGDPEMASLANKYGAKFFLTSARSGANVEESFKELGRAIILRSQKAA